GARCVGAAHRQQCPGLHVEAGASGGGATAAAPRAGAGDRPHGADPGSRPGALAHGPRAPRGRYFWCMTLSSALLDEAVDQLATLPGIGRRTAMRLALDLMRRDIPSVVRFSEAIRRMREELQRCTVCCNISDGPICAICADPRRDNSVICVVEDIRDVIAIE